MFAPNRTLSYVARDLEARPGRQLLPPYWLTFAAAWAGECDFSRPCADELVPAASHLCGFGVDPDAVSINQLLEEANFQPSAGCSVCTSAIRVAAGL